MILNFPKFRKSAGKCRILFFGGQISETSFICRFLLQENFFWYYNDTEDIIFCFRYLSETLI